MALEKRPDRDPGRRQERRLSHHERGHDPNAFFGLDIEGMSPQAQVAVGAVAIVPVVVAAVLVPLLLPQMWWLIFTFGWAIFPAFGLLLHGIAGAVDDNKALPSANGKERELLGALREHGELTPAQAAMEISLTVSEADEMLKGLAEGGHLEVRVRGGDLFYALWEHESAALGSGEQGCAGWVRGMISIPRLGRRAGA